MQVSHDPAAAPSSADSGLGLRRLRPRVAAVSPETRHVLPVLLPVAFGGAVVTAAAAWSFASSGQTWGTLAGVSVLLVAAAIAEALPVPLEGVSAGRTSLATIFIAATATLYGWAPAIVVAVLTMAAVEVANRKPASRVVFNTGLYALSAAAAGAVAELIDGSGLGALALRALAAAGAFYLVNIALLAAIVARAGGGRAPGLLRSHVLGTGAPFAVMASITVILVVLWDSSPAVAIALAGPLAVIALYERRMYAALQRLRELDQLKDEFIAVVSHELRTPLASVYGAAMTLKRPELDAAARESMLRIVCRESDRLARLVDQVLWASRLESGRGEIAFEPVDTVSLAHDVVEAARSRLPDGLTLELRADEGLPPARADRERLRQVLVNLVENAVKYSPDGGRVEVRLERVGGQLRVTVADEGLGIPLAEQERIFEKFHRLDPNQTRGVGGTGLGLYISAELVGRMGGRLSVESEPGEGSAFSIRLPLAAA